MKAKHNGSFQRWLLMAVMVAALGAFTPAQADVFYAGTAHYRANLTDYPFAGTFHVALQEDSHGEPLGLVGDESADGTLLLVFSPRHYFYFTNGSKRVSGRFSVQSHAVSHQVYDYSRRNLGPYHLVTLKFSLRKISAQAVQLTLDYSAFSDRHEFLELTATLRRQVAQKR